MTIRPRNPRWGNPDHEWPREISLETTPRCNPEHTWPRKIPKMRRERNKCNPDRRSKWISVRIRPEFIVDPARARVSPPYCRTSSFLTSATLRPFISCQRLVFSFLLAPSRFGGWVPFPFGLEGRFGRPASFPQGEGGPGGVVLHAKSAILSIFNYE